MKLMAYSALVIDCTCFQKIKLFGSTALFHLFILSKNRKLIRKMSLKSKIRNYFRTAVSSALIRSTPLSYICICICVFVYLCICVFVYLRICVFVYLCICVFVYLCILHVIHGNVIFQILESHAFQKYSTC